MISGSTREPLIQKERQYLLLVANIDLKETRPITQQRRSIGEREVKQLLCSRLIHIPLSLDMCE